MFIIFSKVFICSLASEAFFGKIMSNLYFPSASENKYSAFEMERSRWNLGQPDEKVKTTDLILLLIPDKEMSVLSLT